MEPLEDAYFRWLSAKVEYNPWRGESTPSNSYDRLFRKMHQFPFSWTVTGDDNREQDGVDLRYEFLRVSGRRPSEDWLQMPASVFEVLISFSRIASYETGELMSFWFWHMLDNLGFREQTNGNYNPALVERTLDRFVWRTYDYNGRGGLFPIRSPRRDQRKVEIWYQFCDYLVAAERYG